MRGVISSGGIGDLIMSLPLLERLRQDLGRFQIYTAHPKVLEFYTGQKSLPIGPMYEHMDCRDWEFLIHVTNFSWFLKSGAKGPHLEVNKINRAFLDTHDMHSYITIHPHGDGDASKEMTDKGFNRRSLSQAMLGYAPLPVFRKHVKPFRFWHRDYVTIHIGVGENHAGLVERATKSWDVGYAERLVALIKARYPKLAVVQLGSSIMSPKIAGVDTCFLGLSIEQSFRVLAGSRLHIDGDSGLVHAATTFGVKCLVMFGPTPAHYFGYPENINLSANLPCSGCWWSTPTWVSKCPAGNPVPNCMNMLFPEQIFQEFKRALPE